MVDATLSEHGPVKGGMSCRGMNRLALVHQGDGRHPRVATVARQICERATVAPGGWLRISARASIKKVGPPQLSDRGAPTLKKRKTLDTTGCLRSFRMTQFGLPSLSRKRSKKWRSNSSTR